jgi:MerR family Zn(II)-responsive transcriptional regulator of zntA
MYRIGELATICKIKTDTLRFYDKQGLFVPSSRTESGYRLYTKKDAERSRFILRAKAIGFTLLKISELLSIELDKSNKACADVKSLVDLKLADLNEKIEQLNYFKRALQQRFTTTLQCLLRRAGKCSKLLYSRSARITVITHKGG